MGYNGDYLEGLLQTAKETMNCIKKYKTFNLSLLQRNSIDSLKEDIDKACDVVKELDFRRYKTAKRYSGKSATSKLDHFLAIDDIVYNDEENVSIGIDWTVNLKEVDYKVSKHKYLKQALELVVDKVCVVYIQNEDTLGELEEAALAKAVYKILKKINKAASKYDFAGFLIIDANNI